MGIFIGIDPGSIRTGYGVITSDKNQIRYVTSGVIHLTEQNLSEKLAHIYDTLSEVIHTYSPESAAIEAVFMHHNAQSALKLGQARGAAMVALARAGLSVETYSAKQVKSAVAGYGAADKAQIQQMVAYLLRLSEPPPSDAADALAVAICHANTQAVVVRMKALKQI